jgi:hypothetical protein
MKTIPRIRVLLTVLAAFVWVSSHSAKAGELIFSQYSDNQSTFGPSQLWTPAGVNSEVADDFDVVANIDRVSAGGFVWGAVNFQGVYVRFYAYGADNKPGALQHEYFLAAGNPNVTFNSQSGTIDATLSPAFAATGRHFFSIQPVINYWYWWSANSGASHGQAFYFRNNATGEAWHHGDNLNPNTNADVEFALYGVVTGPGTISSLSTNTLARSGCLQIFGSNFGGDGQVLIDGIPALIANWGSIRIVAYVPEAARLGSVPVRVVSASGFSSNTVNLTVTDRVSNGRLKWRFQADSMYILHRPAIGADGTVVIHDSSGIVYALTSDGALKWIFQTGRSAAGPPSIGADGTVYVAGSATITAINPDGSLKWNFDEPQGGQGVIAGPTVGPDGNIYAVTDLAGLGALALSPTGNLLWSNTGNPVIAEYGQLGVEMSFGPSHPGGAVDQLYVTFDDYGSSPRDHMYAFRLTGEQVWTIPLFMTKDTSGMMQQQRPIVGPNGTLFLSASVATGSSWSLNTFDPASGALLRSYFPSPGNGISVPTIGTDGTAYFAQSLSYLQAVSADLVPKWSYFDGSILSYPIVSPANDIVLTGGAPNYGMPGFVKAFNTSNGQLLWSLNLGIENGGNQVMESIPRFTPDGSTAYFGTAILGGSTTDTFCYLYALDTTGTAPRPTSVVSRKTHGTAGAFDINLPLTGSAGIECRSGGANSDYQVVFTFPTAVTLNGAVVTPQAGKLGSMVGSASVSPDGRTVTLNLTNVTDVQTITMTLSGVNNGTSTNDVTTHMRLFVGDTNGNGSVNASDISQTKSRTGQAVTSANFRSDVAVNGMINASDLAMVKSHSGGGAP